MHGDVVTTPMTIRGHSHQLLQPSLGSEQTIEGILMHKRQTGGFDHMFIQHRQQDSSCREALIAKDIRCHGQLTQAMLDGHLPYAGNRDHGRAGSPQLSGFGPQAWIVKEQRDDHLGVKQEVNAVSS